MSGKKKIIIDTPDSFHLTHERIFLRFPDNTLDRLRDACWQEIEKGERGIESYGLSSAEIIWCWFVFFLIIDAKVAGLGCMKDILSLRYEDIVSAEDEHIKIPRAGDKYPDFLSLWMLTLALSLCLHLRRGRGPGRNRVGEYPLKAYILPERKDPQEPPSADETRHYRRLFQSWLRTSSHHAGLQVSVNQLILLSRSQAFSDLPSNQAFDLMGGNLQNPIPVEQIELVEGFKRDFDLTEKERVQVKAPSFRIPHFTKLEIQPDGKPNLAELGITASEPSQNPLIKLFWKNVNTFVHCEKNDLREAKKKACNELNIFIQAREEELGLGNDGDWSSCIEAFGKIDLPHLDPDLLHITLTAKYALSLIESGTSPNTVSAYLNNILRFLHAMKNTPIMQLDTGRYAALMKELVVAASSGNLMRASMRSFYKFLGTLGIPVQEINWWIIHFHKTIHSQSILDQASIQVVLDYFQRQEKQREIYVVMILLAYYFGLRVEEIASLHLEDIALSGVPTIHVWRSKGDKTRTVRSKEIPENALNYLRRYIANRLSFVNGDRKSFLLLNGKNKVGKDKKFSRQTINAAMEKAFTACHIEVLIGEKNSYMHMLRHACANRWLILGIPLTVIAGKLGHKDVNTLLENYIHVGPYLQKKQIDDRDGDREISADGVTFLLGISKKRLSQISAYEKKPIKTLLVLKEIIVKML